MKLLTELSIKQEVIDVESIFPFNRIEKVLGRTLIDDVLIDFEDVVIETGIKISSIKIDSIEFIGVLPIECPDTTKNVWRCSVDKYIFDGCVEVL